MNKFNLYSTCRVLNTWRWDIEEDTPLSVKASTLAKIEGHVFESEEIEEIVRDIDCIDYDWLCDHWELEGDEALASYIADKVGKQITKTSFTFKISRR